MKGESRENLINDLLQKMPNTTAFEDLPELHLSSSAPNPGAVPRMTRAGSSGGGLPASKRK